LVVCKLFPLFAEAQRNARLTEVEAQAAAILTLAEARAKELEIMTKAISSIVSDRIEKCGILPENCRAVTLFRCAGR